MLGQKEAWCTPRWQVILGRASETNRYAKLSNRMGREGRHLDRSEAAEDKELARLREGNKTSCQEGRGGASIDW